MKNRNALLPSLLLLALSSCQVRPLLSSRSTGAYRHLGGGDIQTARERVHIHFSRDSDQEKLALYNSLNPLIPVDRIIFIGTLHDQWYTVPPFNAQGNALLEAGDRYRYFTLIHWFILCPFAYNAGAEQSPDGSEWIIRQQLLARDFGTPLWQYQPEDFMVDLSNTALLSIPVNP